jgi:hypothetical protein
MEILRREKERRNRKENEAKPTHQVPACTDANHAPKARENGRM